jgi:hypothetical protein
MSSIIDARGSKHYTLSWVALDKHVLLVQLTSEGAYHGAYIGAVKGEDYDAEALGVVANGDQPSSVLTEVYFKDQLGQRRIQVDTHGPYFEEKYPNRGLELFKLLPLLSLL